MGQILDAGCLGIQELSARWAARGAARARARRRPRSGPVAITGGQDGTVRVWNLRAEAWRGEPFQSHNGWVTGAVGEVDGIPVAAGGDDNGLISMWALNFDQHYSAHPNASRRNCCNCLC